VPRALPLAELREIALRRETLFVREFERFPSILKKLRRDTVALVERTAFETPERRAMSFERRLMPVFERRGTL